jgi:DivIVA domain-containing protein
MVDFSSDAIAHRSFRTALRGFDQSEVREFLAELADLLASLAEERDQLASRIESGGTDDLKHEIEVVSKEIHSVLEAARSAAEAMRERAAGEAARWRSEAIADAERARREAQVDAEHLRTDSWTTSETLWTQAQKEADRIRAEAEKESLRLLGEAERDAHRTLGAGRREAEETIRTARMEAEKLVLEARAAHDEIIETATRKAEVAQERTLALEERRDELRRELDSVRSAIAAVESELDERREALGLTAPMPEPSRPAPSGEWTPGETVRVVRPGGQEAHTDELPVVSEQRPLPDPTPELRVLTPQELRSRQQGTPVEELGLEVSVDQPQPEPQPQPQPQPQPEPEPQRRSEPEHESQPEPEPRSQPDPVEPPAVAAPPDDVEGLFARLRDPANPLPVVEEVRAPVQQPVKAVSVSAPSGPDPFAIRDELLLPIANRALRNLKRQLTEEQNGALEGIRLDESGWNPDAKALAASMKADLVVLAAESFTAGHAAAETHTGKKLSRPTAPKSNLASEFAAAITADLARAVADGRAHDHGARQLGADVSRVFRAWRTDESERRIRHYSNAAFNSGLLATLTASEISDIRWVVSGRGCAVCRDLGGRDTFESAPPAHDGCGCLIVPA